MKDTVLGLQFDVNDLDAKYEVVGTSDNYSFQYNLGKGSDLVTEVGDQAQRAISLNGNYGDFTVRVFAVSDIGVRSEFVESGIRINPGDFEDTFKFASINVSNLPPNPKIGSTVLSIPSGENNILHVESEFAERSPVIKWSLEPPIGHALEGQAVSTELIGDSLFDKFSISIKTGEDAGAEAIELTDAQVNQSFGLQNILNSADVSSVLSNYSGFSFEFTDAIFKEFEDKRNFVLEVVAHDFFGRTSTGILSGTNHDPLISLTNNLDGSEMSFAWRSDDTDPKNVVIYAMSYDSNSQPINPKNIFESAEYYSQVKNAQDWAKHINYASGIYAKHKTKSYKCISGYIYSDFFQQRSDLEPQSNNDVWEEIDSVSHFSFEEIVTDQNNYAHPQIFGKCYSYAFRPSDAFATGHIFNLTESGLFRDQDLAEFKSSIEISSLSFREREDDLIFDWEIVDQDGSHVNISNFQFLGDQFENKTLQGLSGSLFDADSEEFLTGIFEGSNVNSYEFTREINNALYETGGWIDAAEWNRQEATLYTEGSILFDKAKNSKDKFRAVSGLDTFAGSKRTYRKPPESQIPVKPVHDFWSVTGEYSEGDVVDFQNSLYIANAFVQNSSAASGTYSENIDYPTGVTVMAPRDTDVNVFNVTGQYSPGEKVLWRGTVYQAKVDFPSRTDVIPGTGTHFDRKTGFYPNSLPGSNSWEYVSPLSALDNFGLYLCIAPNGPSHDPHQGDGVAPFVSRRGLGSNPQDYPYSASGLLPSTGVGHWKLLEPDTATGWGLHVTGYNKSLPWSIGSNFFSGDIVSFDNDLWSGIRDSGPSAGGPQEPVRGADPNQNTTYWTESGTFDFNDGSNDITLDYEVGDSIYYNQIVFRANITNPTGAPAENNIEGQWISEGIDTSWSPVWEKVVHDSQYIFGHPGIPESGKRKIGIDVGIVDSDEKIISRKKIIGNNPPPIILQNGFNVDSLSQTESVTFDFRYAFGRNEKTSKVELYRSSTPDFSITGEDGLPGSGSPNFVKSVLGAAESTFGENINSISDSPPLPLIDGFGHQITGYYYKIMPYDDFGSGVQYDVSDNFGELEKVLIYPKNFHTRFGDGVNGPVIQRSKGDLPGVPVNFSGKTAFENFFLSWEVPFSGDENIDIDKRANNISHYEIWESHEDEIKIAGNNLEQSNNLTGYRRISGDLPSFGQIPQEILDPALGVTNATNSLNVDASSPRIQIVHKGTTNDRRYFWVRSVDMAGNKSPFTGAAAGTYTGPGVKGLDLVLGQVDTTDIADFEMNITKTFPNTLALVPNDPFNDNHPSAKHISWNRHFVYLDGTGYVIGPATTNGTSPPHSYVYWTGSKVEITNDQKIELGLTGAGGGPLDDSIGNPLRNLVYSGDYLTSARHPAGGEGFDPVPEFTGGHHIIARNSDGIASPMWHSFANALIGTAMIENAAIVNATINDVSADKMTAGTIFGHEISIGQGDEGFGSIKSFGFQAFPSGTPQQGFVISGDGSFMFRDDVGGQLSFGDDGLEIRADLRLKDGKTISLVNLHAEPNVFKYNHNLDGSYTVDSPTTTTLQAKFQNVDVASDGSDIQFKLETAAGIKKDYGHIPLGENGNSTFGFSFDSWDNNLKIASATLHKTGFAAMVGDVHNNLIVSITGVGQSAEHTITIFKNKDGEQGETGRSLFYRGNWSPGVTFSGAKGEMPLLADAVKNPYEGGTYWMAMEDHVSAGSFATDFANNKWLQIGGPSPFDQSFDSINVLGDTFIPTVSSETSFSKNVEMRESLGINSDLIVTGNVEMRESLGIKSELTITGAVGVGVDPSGTAGSIICTNDIIAFASSDERLKNNIDLIDSPLEKVLSISGVTFNWSEDAYQHLSGPDIGVIAQNVETVIPEVVATREDGYKAVRYEKLVPLLIEAIKIQEARIKYLEDKLDQD